MYNKSEHIMLYEKALGKEDFSHLHNKTIFITGATGFLGGHIIRGLIKQDKKAIVYARNVKKAKNIHKQ